MACAGDARRSSTSASRPATAASNSAFRLRDSARVMFPRVVLSRPPHKRSPHVNAYPSDALRGQVILPGNCCGP